MEGAEKGKERRAISIKIPDPYRINLDMHEIFKNKMITALKAARCTRKYRMKARKKNNERCRK